MSALKVRENLDGTVAVCRACRAYRPGAAGDPCTTIVRQSVDGDDPWCGETGVDFISRAEARAFNYGETP